MLFFGFKKNKIHSFFLIFCAILLFPSLAYAGLKQIKAYKEAYLDEKPKCVSCHTTDRPKREDGAYDLNDYGKKVKAIKSEPDADAYKQAGKAPEGKS